METHQSSIKWLFLITSSRTYVMQIARKSFETKTMRKGRCWSFRHLDTFILRSLSTCPFKHSKLYWAVWTRNLTPQVRFVNKEADSVTKLYEQGSAWTCRQKSVITRKSWDSFILGRQQLYWLLRYVEVLLCLRADLGHIASVLKPSRCLQSNHQTHRYNKVVPLSPNVFLCRSGVIQSCVHSFFDDAYARITSRCATLVMSSSWSKPLEIARYNCDTIWLYAYVVHRCTFAPCNLNVGLHFVAYKVWHNTDPSLHLVVCLRLWFYFTRHF